MRASSAHAAPRRWGDGGDSNPLDSRLTTWRIDHFCFRHSRRPGNRTLSRLCVGQLLAIELDAVVLRATGETRTHSDGIKSPEPVQSGASRVESCGVELNHRISSLSARRLHQTWPPQGGGCTRIRTAGLLFFTQALFRLSYTAMRAADRNRTCVRPSYKDGAKPAFATATWSRWRESNPRLHVGSVRP